MTFNIEEFQNRFKERAEAVKNRPMPPIGGDERLAFIKQAEKVLRRSKGGRRYNTTLL